MLSVRKEDLSKTTEVNTSNQREKLEDGKEKDKDDQKVTEAEEEKKLEDILLGDMNSSFTEYEETSMDEDEEEEEETQETTEIRKIFAEHLSPIVAEQANSNKLEKKKRKERRKSGREGTNSEMDVESGEDTSGSESSGVLHIDQSNVEDDMETILEDKASKNNLTAANVKSILHQVITNKDVVNMVKNTLTSIVNAGGTLGGVYEPKMTRAKTKEVIEQGKLPEVWALTPRKKPVQEKPSFLEMQFSDDEDDEYHPEKDKEAMLGDSDEESMLSSHASEFGSPFPVTPSTPGVRPAQTSSSSEVFLSPRTPTRSSVRTDLGQVFQQVAESEIHASTEMEVTDDTIARRTRSKLPLTTTSLLELESTFVAPDITADMYDTLCDDKNWQDFLSSLIKTDDIPSQENGDDENNDPEYDYLGEAEHEENDEEDYRFGKMYRIPKTEIIDLLTQLTECTASDPEEEEEVTKTDTGGETTETEEQKKQKQRRLSVKPVVNLELSTSQHLILEDQMRRHVQLSTQLCILCSGSNEYNDIAVECVKHLDELDMFRQSSLAGGRSVFNACNLSMALELVKEKREWDLEKELTDIKIQLTEESSDNSDSESENEALLRPQKDIFWNSAVFLYPDILPTRRLLTKADPMRTSFTPGEDKLIVLGMDQFGATPRYYYLIQKYLLPPKSRKQIYCRIKNLSRTKAHDNPIKRYKEKKILPENTVILNTFSLSKMIAPKYQPLHLLPKWCKKFKNELESRLNIESKALEDTLVETLNSQPQASTQPLESDSDDPKRYDQLNRKLRKKARSKPTDKKKRRERLKPPTKTDLTPFGLPNGSLPTAILTSNGYVVPIKFSSPMKLPPASLDLNPQRHLSLTDGTSPYLYTSDSGAVIDLSEEEKVAGRRAILPAPESGDRGDNPLPAPKLILLNPTEASVAIGQSGQKQLLGDQHSQSETASCESDKIPSVSSYTTGSVRSCGSGNVPVIQNCSGNVLTVSGNTVFAPNSSSSGNMVIAPNSSRSGNVVFSPNSSRSGNVVISPNSPSCGNIVISSNSSTSGNVMIPSNYSSSGNMVITTNCSSSGNILVASNSYSSRNMVVAPTSSESVTLVPSSEKTVLIQSSNSEKTTPVPISSGNIKVSAIQNVVLQKNTTTGHPTQQNVVMQKNPGNPTLQNVIMQKNPGNPTLQNVIIQKNPGNPTLENVANNPLQNVVIQKNPVHGNQPLAASYARSGHIPIIPNPSPGSYSVVQTSSTGNVSVFQLSGSLTGDTADIQSSVQLPVDVGSLSVVHNNPLVQVLENGQICILQNPPGDQVSVAQGFASSKTEEQQLQNSTISEELPFPDFMDTSSPMDVASMKTESQQSVQNSNIGERQPSVELMDTSSSIGLVSSKAETPQNFVNSERPLELMNTQSEGTWSGTETINAAPSPMQTPVTRGEPEMIQTPSSSSSCPSVSGHSGVTVPSASGHSSVTVPSVSGHHLVTIPTSSVSGHSSGPSSTLVPCASGHGTTIAPSFSGHSHVSTTSVSGHPNVTLVASVSGHDTTMSPSRHSHVAVPSVGGQSHVALPSVSGHSLVTTTSISGCVTIPSVSGLSPASTTVPSASGHPTIPTSSISGHHYAHVPSASGHVTTTVPSASGLIPSVSASQSLPPNTNQNLDNQTNDTVDSNPGSVPIEVDEPNPPPTPESKTVVAIPQHNLSGIVLTPVHSPAISVVHSPMPASIMDTEVRNPDRGTFPSPMMDRDVRNPEGGPNPDEVTPTKLTDQSMNLTESSGCTSTFSSSSSSFSASTDSSTICKAVEIMATLAPYYNSYLATPTLTQQEMETTPTKRPRYRELKPKEGSSLDPLQSTPVFKMPETFPKKVSTPDTKKQARPILPKCSVGDGKISPTKRAANHIKRRAQRMYQKGSSPGKLILPKPPEQLPLQTSEQRIPETVAVQNPAPKVPASFDIKDSVQTVPEVQETLDSHQEETDAAKTENANNSAAMTSQDTSTGEEDARPEPVVPALRRSKRRATISKTLETKEASTPRPVVEAAPVVGESPTEEEEDRNTDDQDHIDELMTASTTIRFNPRKPNLDESGTRKTKSQRRKELDTAMLAPDILESDPKRDDRDTAFAQAYIQTVKEKLLHDPDTYERFLTMMCEFGKGNQTPIQLYQELCSLFERYPDLIEDFAGFLRPDEAVACDCFMANQEFQRAVEFLRKVEINFHRQPAQFQKVLKTFTKWQQTPNHSLEEVRGQIRSLIKNSPILLEDFDLFFPEHRVPPSHTSNPDNFEDVDLTSMDMEDETNFDGFEEVHIPTDLDTYRTKRCKCDCHINSNDAKIRSKLKHCYACCLKNVDGGLYFQPSKNKLIPVKVVYYPLPEKYKAGPPPPSPSPSSPLFKSPASTTPLKQRHWAPPAPTVTSPPQGQSSRVLPSVSPLKHCSLKKAKKMKIKTNKNQPGQRRFLSLNEITSPVKGTMTASRETDRVTTSSTSSTPSTSGTTTKPLGSGGILSLPYPSPVLHVPPPPSSTVTSAMMHQSRDVDDYPPLSCTTSSPVLVSQTVGDSDSMTGAVIRIPDNPFNLDVGNMSLSNFLDASRSMGLFDLANEVSSKPWLFNENSSDILAKALKAAEISVDSNFFRNLMSSPSKSQFATSTNPPVGEPLSFKGAVGSLITPTLSQTEHLSSSHPQTEPLSFKGAVEPLTSHPSFKGSVEALTTTSTHPSFKGTVQPLITTQQQNTEPLSFKGAVEPLITTTQQQSVPLSFKGEPLITPTHQPLTQPLSFKGTVEPLASTDIFPSISAVDSILSHPIQTTPSGVSSDITALPPRDKPEGMFPGIQEYLTPDVPTPAPDQPSSVSGVTNTWTMETDKIILEMCQSQGPGDETFALISEKLVNKSPHEVSQRFQSLMEVLSESHEDSDDE